MEILLGLLQLDGAIGDALFQLALGGLQGVNQLLLREQLAQAVAADGGAVSPRMVDVFISQLRAKMEPLNKGRKLIQAMESGYLYSGEIET